jgi:hypothetical protein
VCSADGGAGCVGLMALCEQGVLAACERLTGTAPAESPTTTTPVLTEAAELRQRGEDGSAADLLEQQLTDEPPPRLQAELGLAYQGARRFVGAERLLTEALATQDDPWVTAHRPALQRVLVHAKEHLGWLVLDCTVAGEHAIVGDRKLTCGGELRIETGEHTVVIGAPNRRSAQQTAIVVEGEQTHVSAVLEAAPLGGGDESSGGLATVRIHMLGGATNFVGANNSYFRAGVNPDSNSLALGPRAELRLGIHLGGFLTLEGILGGTRRAFTHWNNCGSGESCFDTFPFANSIDYGAMLQAHTNPRRDGGNLDLHVGVGVRPWTRIRVHDLDTGNATVTSTVIPAELGASLFLGSALSLDVVAQGEYWIPWKYCDLSTSACADTGELHAELAWSALAGLTLHID